jgi:hypothetical protein
VILIGIWVILGILLVVGVTLAILDKWAKSSVLAFLGIGLLMSVAISAFYVGVVSAVQSGSNVRTEQSYDVGTYAQYAGVKSDEDSPMVRVSTAGTLKSQDAYSRKDILETRYKVIIKVNGEWKVKTLTSSQVRVKYVDEDADASVVQYSYTSHHGWFIPWSPNSYDDRYLLTVPEDRVRLTS